MLRFILVVLAVGAVAVNTEHPRFRIAKQVQQQQQKPPQQQPQQKPPQQQPQQHQQQLSRQIPITFYTKTGDDAGQFSLQYQDGDGTVFTEQGILKLTPDGKDLVLVKSGSYSYLSPEGVPIQVSYEADEGGFRPVSNSIPVAPVPAQVH